MPKRLTSQGAPAPEEPDARALLEAARRHLFSVVRSRDSDVARLGRAAMEAARRAGDAPTEAAAHYYALIRDIMTLPPDEAQRILKGAAQRCQELQVPVGLKLVQLLRAARLYKDCRFVECANLSELLLRDTSGLHTLEVISLLNRFAYACQWSGRHDELFESAQRALRLADEIGHVHAQVMMRINLGGSLVYIALDPKAGLPLLEQAQQMLSDKPVTAVWTLCVNNRISALDMLGRHEQAYAVFVESVTRPGAQALAQATPAISAAALIGVGRLDEAERWLGDEPPQTLDAFEQIELQCYRVSKVRLLCAQGRYQQALSYGREALDDVGPLHREPIYDLYIHDFIRQACLALNDVDGALAATTAASQACLPVVRMSSRARYLMTQLEAARGGAEQLGAVDLRRLQAVEQALAAQRDLPAPPQPAAAAPQDPSAKAAEPASAAAPAQVPPFLAHVVHELRNPIGGVMGLAELLMRSDLDSRQRDYVLMMKGSAQTLLALVGDVLDLAKLESGRFQFKPEEVVLHDWLQATVAPFIEQAGLKGLVLNWTIEPDVAPRLVFDPLRLRQVLYNLLSNALKFTRVGSIGVHVRMLPTAAPGQAGLRFEVSDTGRGIADDAKEQLFQEFVQADSSIAQSHGGTGLGLALCKQFVERLGGRIGFDSALGVGSCFWFELALPVFEPDALAT